MRDLGIYFGTFAPCHVGHFEQIIRAKRDNQHALIIVSGYEGDRGDEFGMSLEHRVKAMKQLLKKDGNVTVMKLDETHIPRYPAGWEPWLEMLAASISSLLPVLSYTVKTVNYYVGEEEYIEPLQVFFDKEWPDVDTTVTQVDRQELKISGTNIRNDALLNWDYVTRPFRKFFVQNVLVTGAPNSGKSILVKDLARRYSTSHSIEYRKEYFEQHQVGGMLDIKDFHAIGIGQFELNRQNIHSPATRKVFFADTDVMTSKVHTKIHEDSDDFKQLYDVFNYYISLQNWALILLLPPDENNTETDKKIYESLLAEIKKQELNHLTHELTGESYRDVYQEAHSLVNEVLKEGKDN